MKDMMKFSELNFNGNFVPDGMWLTSPMVCRVCGDKWMAVHENCEHLFCKDGHRNQTPPLDWDPPDDGGFKCSN